MDGEINVVALVRGEEQYIFLFDEANRTETLRMLGRYAADPELSMTWYDAAVLSQKVRDMVPTKSAQSAPAPNAHSHSTAHGPVSTSSKLAKSTPRFKMS